MISELNIDLNHIRMQINYINITSTIPHNINKTPSNYIPNKHKCYPTLTF